MRHIESDLKIRSATRKFSTSELKEAIENYIAYAKAMIRVNERFLAEIQHIGEADLTKEQSDFRISRSRANAIFHDKLKECESALRKLNER